MILEGQGKPPQLVYKHSIVSVAPMRHPNYGPASDYTEAEPTADNDFLVYIART